MTQNNRDLTFKKISFWGADKYVAPGLKMFKYGPDYTTIQQRGYQLFPFYNMNLRSPLLCIQILYFN